MDVVDIGLLGAEAVRAHVRPEFLERSKPKLGRVPGGLWSAYRIR